MKKQISLAAGFIVAFAISACHPPPRPPRPPEPPKHPRSQLMHERNFENSKSEDLIFQTKISDSKI